jgi:hypothetical protein
MSDSRQVWILRDGQEIGTCTVVEALLQLHIGGLKSTDFYWEEGMVEWAPLSKLWRTESVKERPFYGYRTHPGMVPGKDWRPWTPDLIPGENDLQSPKAKAENDNGGLSLIIPLIVWLVILFCFVLFYF